MRVRSAVLILCATVFATGLVYAAAPAQIRVQVNLVNLFATVRDKHKVVVNGLTKDDFQVYEDGRPQEITNFSTESDLPITLGLLIDTSGSEEYTLNAEKNAASQFLSRVMRKGDLAMVISFDLDVDLLADFTEDRSRLDRAINRAEINAPGTFINQGPLPTSGSGGTNFYDAVYLAAHDKLASEAGRKAIIVLTDAEDTGSRLGLEDAIEAAQRSDTVVHILLVAQDGGDQAVAKRLTDETGGRMIVVRSEKNLEAAFDEISDELRSQYVLGYTSTNTKHDGAYRKIRVDMKNKDYSALARKGYYAPND